MLYDIIPPTGSGKPNTVMQRENVNSPWAPLPSRPCNEKGTKRKTSTRIEYLFEGKWNAVRTTSISTKNRTLIPFSFSAGELQSDCQETLRPRILQEAQPVHRLRHDLLHRLEGTGR